MKIISHIDKINFSAEQDSICVEGWVVAKNDAGIQINVIINEKKVSYEMKTKARADVSKIYHKFAINKEPGFCLTIPYDKSEKLKSILIEAVAENKTHIILSKDEKNIEDILNSQILKYSIDNLEKCQKDGKEIYIITGWAAVLGKTRRLDIRLKEKETDREIPYEKEEINREDLIFAGIVSEDQKTSGFKIVYESNSSVTIIFEAPDYHISYVEEIEKYIKRNKRAYHKLLFRQILRNIKFSNCKKLIKYIMRHGFKGLKQAILNGMAEDKDAHYNDWFERHKATEAELEQQKNHKFDFEPKISILVPTYNTPIKLLRQMVDSVRNQSYANWELCIADGSKENKELEAVLKEYAELDKRIIVNILEKNAGIAGNTNGALKIATGDYIGLLDHDDLLAPNALYEVVK
ncbi:MAG: glycosyltransferase, partial [Lachnospiraceae bacterium]|nr:glycosyltransferase [Lachnospiraceae bacterium]